MTPYPVFRRALENGDARLARAAAAELPSVALEDALALCLLHREQEPAFYEGMAVRWLSRFCREVRGVTLPDAQLLAAALQGLAPASAAASTLADLCDRYGLERAVRTVEEWADT